jgi:hypothetical protein
MRHRLHYTLEEARDLRAWVGERVHAARAALAELSRPEARAALEAIDLGTGGAWPGRDVARAMLDLQRSVGELGAADIVVRDVPRGLVDFPAVQGGVEVYLCWLVDEPDIGWWHELDAGFAGRRPLSEIQ